MSDHHQHHLLAERPWRLTRSDWVDVVKRVWKERSDDDVATRAAAVAFSAMFAIPTLLIAVVSIYGLVSSPSDVAGLIERADEVLPSAATELLESQLQSIASQGAGSLSLGLILGLAGAVFSVSGGVNRLSETINEIYDEEDRRPWYVKRAWAVVASTAVIVGLVVAVGLITLLPTMARWLEIDGMARMLVEIGRWIALAAVMLILLGSLYRFGPKRSAPRVPGLTVGTTVAIVAWSIMSIGFGVYVQTIANYDRTYGSLGSVIVFMTWLYLSSYIVLLAGELNAELERQTLVDTTVEGDEPMGRRGAAVADAPADDVADDHPDMVAEAEQSLV